MKKNKVSDGFYFGALIFVMLKIIYYHCHCVCVRFLWTCGCGHFNMSHRTNVETNHWTKQHILISHTLIYLHCSQNLNYMYHKKLALIKCALRIHTQYILYIQLPYDQLFTKSWISHVVEVLSDKQQLRIHSKLIYAVLFTNTTESLYFYYT